LSNFVAHATLLFNKVALGNCQFSIGNNRQTNMALVTQTTIISRPKCFVNRFNALSSKSYGNANQPLTRNVSKY